MKNDATSTVFGVGLAIAGLVLVVLAATGRLQAAWSVLTTGTGNAATSPPTTNTVPGAMYPGTATPQPTDPLGQAGSALGSSIGSWIQHQVFGGNGNYVQQSTPFVIPGSQSSTTGGSFSLLVSPQMWPGLGQSIAANPASSTTSPTPQTQNPNITAPQGGIWA